LPQEYCTGILRQSSELRKEAIKDEDRKAKQQSVNFMAAFLPLAQQQQVLKNTRNFKSSGLDDESRSESENASQITSKTDTVGLLLNNKNTVLDVHNAAFNNSSRFLPDLPDFEYVAPDFDASTEVDYQTKAIDIMLEKMPSCPQYADKNGWLPLHHAVTRPGVLNAELIYKLAEVFSNFYHITVIILIQKNRLLTL
jgi:hypothetical protein